MRNVTVKYLHQDKRTGSFVYRRRVPKSLAGLVDKSEFIAVLGRTQVEAVVQYGQYHERVEHMVSLAKNGVTGFSPIEQQKRLAALLREWGADPHGPGRDLNELTWRDEAAERLVGEYRDEETGQYRMVPEEKAALAGALLEGVGKEEPEVTVTDAFKFYLEEKALTLPDQRKKQVQRFARAERNLTFVLGGDKPVGRITRADARAWRDMREGQKVSPATIRREMNDIRAVINLANSELSAGEANPFNGLKTKKDALGRQKQRKSLPQSVIDGVYEDLSRATQRGSEELRQIWTLIDWTGARPSEVRMLTQKEIVIDHAVPHIVVQARSDRTLKSDWSERKIPLVGEALEVASEVVGRAGGCEYAFPRFGAPGGQDRLSQALRKYVRNHTGDPKHVPYSLRHNMKDRMRKAEVASGVFNPSLFLLEKKVSQASFATFNSGPSASASAFV